MRGNVMNSYKKECSRKEDLITYLYGECTPKEEKEFKLHLQECSSCKQESAELGMLRQNLQAWNMQETPRVVLDLATERPRARSLKEILQELSSALPAWFKFGTGFATACAGILLMLAVFNTQIRYDQNGFSFQVALFSNKTTTQSLDTNASTNDEVTRALVAKVLSEKEAELNQALEAKRSEIEAQLRKQIDVISGELSEKSNSQLSKTSLELKRQHRAELEKALNQLQRQRNQDAFEDDPFNLWGGVNEKVLQKAVENGYGSYPSGN